jgi:hypothetical protein
MIEKIASEHGFSTRAAAVIVFFASMVAILVVFAGALRQFIHESFMQRVTSAHYEILCPPGALTQDAMTQFASQRESLFTTLDGKLRDAGSDTEIRVIFNTDSSTPADAASAPQPYTVAGTTIRTKLSGRTPQLDPAADAEALLHVAWGKPGNPEVARWVAMSLAGESQGEDLGMAAAGAEQRLGHKKVSSLLEAHSTEISSPSDRAILGAAWVSEIVEFGGPAAVRKLYSAKFTDFNEAEVAQILGTTPAELERKWQLWMYAYLAGMPPASNSMPANMRMRGGQ